MLKSNGALQRNIAIGIFWRQRNIYDSKDFFPAIPSASEKAEAVWVGFEAEDGMVRNTKCLLLTSEVDGFVRKVELPTVKLLNGWLV